MDILGFSVPVWLILAIFIIVLLYIYGTWTYDYFTTQGIPGPKPWPLFGHLPDFFLKGACEFDQECLKKYGKILGLYNMRNPMLMVADCDLIKQITVKEFNNFPNRRRIPGLGRPFDLFLLRLEDENWKRVRSLMTPAFSTGKLKAMTQQMNECSDTFVKCLLQKGNNSDVKIKNVTTAFTTDVIARTAFGIELNSQENPNDVFVKHINYIMKPRLYLQVLTVSFPKIARLIRKYFVGVDSPQFFVNLTKKLVEERETEIQSNTDLLQLMMNAHKQTVSQADMEEDKLVGFSCKAEDVKRHKGMTIDELTAQSVLFFLAGSETTATTISCLCYNLALNPEIQERVAKEIDDVIGDKEYVSSDMCNNLTYLDQCIMETLRVCPPALRVDRLCKEDITINGIEFKKDMLVMIPVYAIHHNPEYWPNPEKFDPDRFTPEMKANRDPMTYIPFGFGPRNCIGMRLAQMEVKVAMAKILQKLQLGVSTNTKVPLDIKNSLVLLQTVTPIMITVSKRNK